MFLELLCFKENLQFGSRPCLLVCLAVIGWLVELFCFRSEIEELKAKVLKERERYQSSTQTFSDDLSAIPILEVKHTVYRQESLLQKFGFLLNFSLGIFIKNRFLMYYWQIVKI